MVARRKTTIARRVRDDFLGLEVLDERALAADGVSTRSVSTTSAASRSVAWRGDPDGHPI